MKLALSAVLIFLAGCIVGSIDYRTKKAMEIEGIRFKCECKPKIMHREFLASMCDSGGVREPVFVECLYERRDEGPL